MIDTSSIISPFQQNPIRDTNEILKRLRSPEVLFDCGGDDPSQNICPICLESLVDYASSVIISPRGPDSKQISKMKSEKMR